MTTIANLGIKVSSEGVDKTEKALDKLSATSTKSEKAIDRLIESVKKQNMILNSGKAAYTEYAMTALGASKAETKLATDIVKATESIKSARKSATAQLKANIAETKAGNKERLKGIKEVEKAEKKRVTEIGKIITALDKEEKALKMSKHEQAEYNLALLGASKAEKEAARQITDRIKAIKAAKKAEDDSIRAIKKSKIAKDALIKSEQKRRDAVNTTIMKLRDEVAVLGGSERELLKYKLTLAGATTAEKKQALALQRTALEFKRSREASDRYKQSIADIGTTMLGYAGIFGVSGLIKTADTWTLVASRLALVTEDTEALVKAEKDLFSVAQETRQSYEQTGNLYARIARSTKELNLSQEELLGVTETINKSLILSGSSAQAADAAITQLGQGFSFGALRGENLNSVLEQAPRLAEAIADSMGISATSLKVVAEQNRITSKVIVEALKKGSESAQKISEEFGKMDTTVGQSGVKVSNAMGKMISEFDRAYGVTGTLAAGFSTMADNMDNIADAVKIAAIASIPTLIMKISEAAIVAAGSMKALNATLVINPWVAAATAILAAAAAIDHFHTSTNEALESGSVKIMRDKIKDLRGELSELNELAEDPMLGGIGYNQEIKATEKAIADLERAIKALTKTKKESKDAPGADPAGLKQFQEMEKAYSRANKKEVEFLEKSLSEYKKYEKAKPEVVKFYEQKIADEREKSRKRAESAYKKAHAAEIKAEKDAAKQIEDALKKLRREEDKRQKGINDTIAGLKKEKETYGMSRSAILEYTLTLQHATPEEIAQAKALADTIEKLEEKTRATEEYEEAAKKHAKEIEDATKDLSDTIQDKTADIISDWDNAGDMLVDIAKRTAAEMAAAFATQKFIMPAVQQIGGAMGMDWGGVPVSQMGGGGFQIPSPQSMQWAGKNIPGMGALSNAMAWNMPGTGTTVATPYAAQYLGTSPSVTLGGTTLGASLGYGGLGSIGYTMIGGKLGLPQGKYSGIGAGIGGALGGTYAGSLFGAGAAGMAGAAGGAAAGATAGSVVPVIGTVIGAIIGGLLGSLGGGEKRPDVRIASAMGMEGIEVGFKDVSGKENRQQIETAVSDYFNNRISELDEITTFSVDKAIKDAGFYGRIRLDKLDEEDPASLFKKLIESAFFGTQARGEYSENLKDVFLEQMDLSKELFDADFFKNINIEGEDFIQTFGRFADIAEEFGNFNERIASQVEKGISTEQAFQNMSVIAGVMESISAAGEKLEQSSTINVIRSFVESNEQYISALEEASATEQELADVQSGIATQIGASISGLTADSLQSVLVAGGDITQTLQDTLRGQAASTIAGLASERVMQEYGNSLNEMIGKAFLDIDVENLSSGELTSVFNSIIESFDWEGMGQSAQIVSDAINEFTDSMGESEQVIKSRNSLNIQIMELEGKESEALAISRQIELDAMDKSLRPLQERVWALKDEQEEGIRLSKIAKDKTSIEIQIMELEGKTSEALALKRKLELESMDESLRPLQERIWALQEEQEQLNITAGLEKQWATLIGDTSYLRELDIKGMNESNIALYDKIKAQEDLAKATEEAERKALNAKNNYISALQSELSILKGNLDTARSNYISGLENEISTLEGGYNDAKSTYLEMLNKEASTYEDLAKTIGSAIDSIEKYRLSLFSETTPTPERGDILFTKQRTLAEKVSGGDIESVSDLISISGEYIETAKETSRTSVEYRRKVGETNALLLGVQDSLEGQLTEAEKQEKAFKELIEGVNGVDEDIVSINDAQIEYYRAKKAFDNNWYKDEIKRFEEEKTIDELRTDYYNAKEELDNSWYKDELASLNGIDLSINEFKDLYKDALEEEKTAKEEELLAKDTVNNSLDLDISPFANGGYNPGGLSLIGEKGPELSYRPPSQIMSNSDMMGALSNEQVVSELKQLRTELARANFAIAKNTQDTAKTVKKLDRDGIEIREEAA